MLFHVYTSLAKNSNLPIKMNNHKVFACTLRNVICVENDDEKNKQKEKEKLKNTTIPIPSPHRIIVYLIF